MIAAALGVIAGAYTAVKKAQDAAAKAEEERIQANRDAVSEQEARLARLNELTGAVHRTESKDLVKL